jgi:mono/diheme cytochrome c family protein
MSDGQLYWVVSQGVRATGMPAFSPTHSPQEIWQIVSFVRHLPKLSDAEVAELKKGREDEQAHHGTNEPGEKKSGAASPHSHP